MWDFILCASTYGIVLLGIILLVCYALLRTSSPYPVIRREPEEAVFYDPTTKKTVQLPLLSDPWSVHLSVVIPAYNEEKRIGPMLDECFKYLEARGDDFIYEVIVVSDGSDDRTVDVAHGYAKTYGPRKVRVLNLTSNRGKGGAVRLGVQNTRGSVILFADADGATKFEDLAKLEASLATLVDVNYIRRPAVVSETLGVVCGSRAHLEDAATASRSLFRTVLMHGFHCLVWAFAVRNIRDTQCGFKLFTRQAAKLCFPSLHVEKWAFDVELLFIAQSLNIPITEVAVNWTEIEGSKIVPVWSWLQMGKDLFVIWLRYAVGAWKLKKGKYMQ